MIQRSSSSKRRKRHSPSNSPNKSATSSLTRKPTVAFANLPTSDEGSEGEKEEKKPSSLNPESSSVRTTVSATRISASSSAARNTLPTTSSSRSTTSGSSSEHSSGFRGSITVTDADTHGEFTIFDDEYSGTKLNLNQFKGPRGNPSYPSRGGTMTTDIDSFSQRTPSQMTRKSSRISLIPPDSSKSPRNSLIPDDAYQRGPRGSIDPGALSRSGRNSLLPEGDNFSRTARPSLIADMSLQISGRNTLPTTNTTDLGPNRISSRTTGLSADNTNIPRSGLSVESINRSPRGSLVPDYSTKSPRGSLVPEGNNWTPRGSLVGDSYNTNRSTPRGSVASEGAMYPYNRNNSRTSLQQQDSISQGKSPRGSNASSSGVQFDLPIRTPRGSIESAPPLTGKSSSNVGNQNQRSISPFRTGSLRISPRNAAGNSGQGNISAISSNIAPTADAENSRRASSNVSQVSSDDRRHLCEHTKLNQDTGLGLTAYGSFVYQLNHANMESSSIFDFVFGALRIVYRTVIVTVLLVILTILPALMLIMGVEFVKDCPKEPRIPLYMIVGGCFGLIMILWILWYQIRSLRYERLSNPSESSQRNENEDFLTTSAGIRLARYLLAAFLVIWFIFGNHWIYGIYWPEFKQTTIFEPDGWCNKTLYIFALIHLFILYSVIGCIILITLALGLFQICFLRCR